jgi:hypothetical protein
MDYLFWLWQPSTRRHSQPLSSFSESMILIQLNISGLAPPSVRGGSNWFRLSAQHSHHVCIPIKDIMRIMSTCPTLSSGRAYPG